jgi:apolipoprotein N-acyltransferase
MKLKYVFMANAVISLVLGCALVVASPLLMTFFGINVQVTQGGMAVTRLFGAAIIGYGLVAWLARNAPDSEGRRAIVLAFFIAHAVSFIVAVPAQLSGVANVLGWLIVAIYLLLALGYGYFQFVKPGAS